jgi:hypothetical protein
MALCFDAVVGGFLCYNCRVAEAARYQKGVAARGHDPACCYWPHLNLVSHSGLFFRSMGISLGGLEGCRGVTAQGDASAITSCWDCRACISVVLSFPATAAHVLIHVE